MKLVQLGSSGVKQRELLPGVDGNVSSSSSLFWKPYLASNYISQGCGLCNYLEMKLTLQVHLAGGLINAWKHVPCPSLLQLSD